VTKNKTAAILGSLIVGTAFALLASYKEFRQLTESIMTILAVAGFLLTIWQIYRSK
jgi:hypothetical protein